MFTTTARAVTTLRSLLVRGLALMTVAVMSACGGGGGGSDTPKASISLSSNQVSVSATTDQVPPMPTVQVNLANPPAGGVYAGYTTTSVAVVGVDITGISDTAATVAIFLQAPVQLGVGVYHDTVTIYVCFDQQCKSQVGNSPQTIAVEYRVTPGQTPPPGAPSVQSLSPPSVVAGGAGFTLTVTGSGFVPQSVLQWNGAARPTTFVSASQLTAQIAGSDIATPATVAITVSNLAAGGVTSVPVDFTVQAPAVQALTRVSPTRVTAAGPAFVLTAVGTGFSTSSIVQWNGTARPTTYVSATELTAQISATDIAQVGNGSVTVFNPAGSGAQTAARPVAIALPSTSAVAFQVDAGHSGTVHFNNVSLPTASTWSVDLGGNPSYALIAAGKVFATVDLGSNNSQLVALDQRSGVIAWGPIVLSGVANAAYDAGAVFVLSSVIGNAGLLQAFDAASGSLKWSTVLVGQYSFSSPPTAANGLVFTGGAGSGGTLYAVDQNTGVIAWTRPVANGDSSAPAVTADGVYVNYPCQTYAFRPATGTPVWSDNSGCSGGGGATPVAANGVLYAPNGFGSYNGSTFDATTGALLGSYAADNPPAIDRQTGYFLQGGTLRGVALASNTALWSFAGDGQLVTSPVVVSNHVFVGAGSGKLFAVNASTGQQESMFQLGAAIPAGAGWGARMPISGLSAGDGLLVVPAGHALTAFTLSTSP